MIQYKLIKKYPNSLEVGKVVTFTFPDNKDSFDNGFNIKLKTCIDNPEFWQKIPEPKYQVLSFANVNKDLATVQKDGLFRMNSKVNEHANGACKFSRMLEIKEFTIHSVKRLSDDEVFTIGDITNKGNVRGFTYYSNQSVHIQTLKSNNSAYNGSLQDITKTGLFITEDGVSIYEGDQFYIVDNHNKDYRLGYNGVKGMPFVASKYTPLDNHKSLYFSSRQKAEEFIEINKKKFSINDLLESDLLEEWTNKTVLKDKLIKLSKKVN